MGDQHSPAAVARAVALAGPGATVRDIRALAGGAHARTSLVRTVDPEREFVLREFGVGDDAAGREMQVLAALDGLRGAAPVLLAPLLLAGDATGDRGGGLGGGPWTLISRLPGAADIRPDDPVGYARQLGRALARIHAAELRREGWPSVFGRAGGSPGSLFGPAAGLVAARWDEVASAPAVLTHYDYWSGNTVWQDGTLSGVVDWSGACRGPRCYDLGWGRLDLYLLYDEQVAGAFSDAYVAAAGGVSSPDVLLGDLWAAARSHRIVESWVPNYRDLGRPDLTARVLRERHTAWTRRLSSNVPGTLRP